MNDEKVQKMHLGSFLLEFSPDVRDYNTVTDEQVSQELAERYNEARILELQDIGHKVLDTEPFPWEWVRSKLYACVYDEEKQEWVDDNPVLYHKWLTKVLDLLEKEAKKQGKFHTLNIKGKRNE